jgi:hypothetical protein
MLLYNNKNLRRFFLKLKNLFLFMSVIAANQHLFFFIAAFVVGRFEEEKVFFC